jgi:hypothetical protein
MKNVDLTYIIPVVASLISFISLFFLGKGKIVKDSSANIFRYIPLFSVIALLSGVFYLTYYYQNEILKEKEKFLALQQQSKYYEDSILTNKAKTDSALVRLKILNNELNGILTKIKRQEKITGESSGFKDKVQAKIVKVNEEIEVIESYNEIIDRPNYLKKGYNVSGNTSNFVFFCPTDKASEYIDLKLTFQDEKIVEKIDCIYLTVIEIKENGEKWLIFSQAYKPKNGDNIFKIKNYIKEKNTTLEIGYFLNTEINKENPTFEKISCKSNFSTSP